MSVITLFLILLVIVLFVKVPAVKSILRYHWLLTGYVVILLISWGLISIHSVGEVVGKEVKINNLEMEDTSLYKEVIAGKLNKVMDRRAYKNWSFPHFQGYKLIINTSDMETSAAIVVVERKKVNDSKIEAVYFKSMTNEDGKELVANPIGLRLVGNSIIIQKPKRSSFHYSVFKNPSPIRQFTGESGIDSSNFSEGHDLLYLKTPHNVEIVGNSNLEIEYVHN